MSDSLSNLAELSRIDISYSRLSTYAACPAKYFYTYVLNHRGQFGSAAAMGKMLHTVLENHIETLDLDLMYQEFITQRSIEDPNLEITPEQLSDGKQMLVNFYDAHVGQPIKVFAKELPFSLHFGVARVNGYIDRVDVLPDGSFLIVDYKSGRIEVPAKNIHDDLQLGIYALAINELYPGRGVHAEMYYLRTQRRKGHTFTQEDLLRVRERVRREVSNLINDLEFSFTANSSNCRWCDHAKSGECAVGVSRTRKRY